MIKELVRQLSDAQFKSLSNSLSVTKADKFYRLLVALRDAELSDVQIREQLNVSTQAYYTLKSRLLDKIQKFQLNTTIDSDHDLAITVQAIPRIMHEQSNLQAINSLLHLAEELRHKDMPWELVQVYSALMRICSEENKYYEYSSQYNKHVAFALALDKAGDLLARYNTELRKYYFDGSANTKELCSLLLKELKNLSELYSSHRLRFYYTLTGVIHKLHFPNENFLSDRPVDVLVADAEHILSLYPDDPKYRTLHLGLESLKFQYYHRLELHESNKDSMRLVCDNITSYVQLGYCVPMYSFLQDLTSRLTQKEKLEQLMDYMNKMELSDAHISVADQLHLIELKCALLASGQEYQKIVKLISKVLGELSLKQFPIAEIYFKLLLCYNYLLCHKTDQAESVLRSVTRKYKDETIFGLTPAGAAFCKFLKCAITDHSKQRKMNLIDFRDIVTGRKRQDIHFPGYLQLSDSELALII